MINLATAATLTEWSKRTLWRRISDGTLTRSGDVDVLDDKKTKIPLDMIKAHICVPMQEADFDLIELADAGDAEAQTDLAVLFLSYKKPESALYWLELAAKQNYAGAMYLLGRCHTEGNGLQQNDSLGIMWIAKAASQGHLIAQGVLQAALEKITTKTVAV